MKKCLISAALTLTVVGAANAAPVFFTNAADPALAGASSIDFNSEALGAFTSRTFDGAVVFSSPQNLFVKNTYSGGYASSGRYVANQENPDPVTISFVSAVSALGFNWGAADQPWIIEVFDTSNALLGILNVAAQTSPYAGFIGIDGDGALIGSVRLTDQSSYGYDYFLLDNLQYVTGQQNHVSEPAGIALVGLGLAALGLSRRRKSGK